MSIQVRYILTLVFGIFLIGLLLAGLKQFELEAQLLEIISWVEDAGVTGEIIFAVIIIAAVLFCLPSILLTLGAGFIYGVIHGTILLVCAETIASVIAFLIARYVVGNRVGNLVNTKSRLYSLGSALESEGWSLVAITRIMPFFPFKISNYLFGITKVRLSSFSIGTFVGLWPIAMFNVYIGSIAADMLTLGQTDTPAKWAAYAFTSLLFLFCIYYLVTWAKTTLDRYSLPE